MTRRFAVLILAIGLSIVFVIIWLLGDLCNIAGAVMAGLLPTIIILGVYVRLEILI